LLGSRGDKHFFGFCNPTHPGSHPPGEKILEGFIAIGGSVLKNRFALFFEDGCGLEKFLYRKNLGIRHASGERNHAGFFGKLEKLPYGGRLEIIAYLGVEIVPCF